jgi:hypothetical protein
MRTPSDLPFTDASGQPAGSPASPGVDAFDPAGTSPASRRCPSRPARHHTRGVIGALNAEWRLLAEDPRTRRAVTSWWESVPALSGLQDLPAVVTAASAPGDREVLSGLLLLARGGDVLAARAALQVMLGPAVRLARRTRGHAGGDMEESIARAIAATWQVVRDYPIERRTCRPADGISLDVLAALTAGGHRRAEIAAGLPSDLADRAEPEPPDVGELREAFWSLVRPGTRPVCADEQVVMLLAWGVRSRAVSVADAQLLLRLHSPDDPDRAISGRELAEQLGLAHAAVRQRASRAARRLAAAVRQLVSPDAGAHSCGDRAAA